MNKFLKLGFILSVLLSLTTYSNAVGFKMGASATGASFSADGKEVADSNTAETRSEDLYIGYASIFAEAELNDQFSVGLSYVPYALESETVENTRKDHCAESASCTTVAKTVQVDIVDLASMYAKFNFGDNLYGKV